MDCKEAYRESLFVPLYKSALPCKGCKELRLNEADNRFVFGISQESLIPLNCLPDERATIVNGGERGVDKRG